MRYFRVDITAPREIGCEDEEGFGSAPAPDNGMGATYKWASREFRRYADGLGPLYSELGKEAIVEINDVNAWEGGPYLTIVMMDARASEADAQEMALPALDEWRIGLETESKVSVTETTFFKSVVKEKRQSFFHSENVYIQAGLYEFAELCRESDGLLNEYFSDHQVDLEEALSTAEDTMYHEAFEEELPRIFSSDALGASDQIPFGYLIEGTQEREVSQAVDLLVPALRSSGRTCSSHVIRINCDAVSSGPWNPNSVPYAKLLGSPLAEALRGNTVVVSYGRFDEGGTYSPRQLNFFRTLMAKLAKVCDTTQVIFVTPEGKPDVMHRVKKTLPLPVIELRKDRIPSLQQGRSEVLEHLKHRAEIDGAEPDAALERLVDERTEDKSALDPEKVFREWRVRSSVEKNCPAYQEEVERYYENACSEESSALEKLDELIGLDQVKRVVTVSGNVDNDILESAIGSVLFIDEAYNLKDLPHTVANLIAFMENHREDTMVILAGYKDSIERLIDSNPGFRSRLGGIIEFPDYTVDELCDIFQLMCRRAKIESPQETVSAVHDLVARGGRRADQGNGRYVRNIFGRALRAQRVRLAEAFPEGEKIPLEDLKTLLPRDLLTHEEAERLEKPQMSAREQLNSLIGLEDVKKLIGEHLDLARVEKIR
jgi:hypothetical protein